VKKKVDLDDLRLQFDFNKMVTRASQLKKEDEIEVQFYDNSKTAKVTK